MLDSTIVIVTGEFGRTPEINAGGGRDHWPTAFSLTMAGGGITGGRVYGSTDEKGGFVKDNPVHRAAPNSDHRRAASLTLQRYQSKGLLNTGMNEQISGTIIPGQLGRIVAILDPGDVPGA